MNKPLPPGAFAKAFQEQQRVSRRKKLLWWGIGGGLLLLVLAAGYLVFLSPVLATRQVEVSGTSLLSKEQILDVAAVPLGLPQARQDLGEVEARVAELPEVASVEARLAWPSTVQISVSERVLVYQRKLDGKVDWVDATGTIFHRTDEPTEGAPVVTTKTTDQRLLADIATVVSHLPEQVRADLDTMSAEAVDQITLKLSGRRKVEWGSADNSELKGEVLAALLATDASVYDVSAPLHPTTVPR